MARHALLIGVSEFQDKRLARLNAPTNDVLALRGVLQDRARGEFDTVDLSLDEDFLAVRDRVSRFFHDKAPEDLLFLYYSGHGILGRNNRLYLATAGSDLDSPRERSLAAKEIREFIDESRARKQVVVLDCCHSGAFAEYAKSGGHTPAVTADTFASGDAGLYVLTAADALQYAWDGPELRTGAGEASGGPVSRFTSWLVAGLQKGEAAPHEETITMDDLYAYLFRRAKEDGAPSTPQRFVHGGVGDLKISRNPDFGAANVDPALVAGLGAADRLMRMGAATALVRLMREWHTAEAKAAGAVLRRHLQRESDGGVREVILAALEEARERAERQREEEQGILDQEAREEEARRRLEEREKAKRVKELEEDARMAAELTAARRREPPLREAPRPDGHAHGTVVAPNGGTPGTPKPIDFDTILKVAGAIFLIIIALAIFA